MTERAFTPDEIATIRERFLAWINEPVRTPNYTPTEDDWWRAIK